MPRLIINADDFGLTPGINRAIAECNAQGIVTSATLMAKGAARAEAAELAANLPGMSIGCHVVLVDGFPVLPPGQIPTVAFATEGTQFAPSLGGFVQRLAAGRFDADQIEAEATAQFSALRNSGVQLTHFDTHKHTHVFPAVLRPLLRAARASGIRAVRNPFVPRQPLLFPELRRRPQLWKRYWQTRALRRFLPAFQRMVAEHGMVTHDGCLGVLETGFLDADLLAAIVAAIRENTAAGPPSGTWELVCHPGYDDADLAAVRTRLRSSRQIERQLLCSEETKTLLAKNGIELISYRDLT